MTEDYSKRWIRAGSQQDHAGLQSSDQTAQHTPVARPAVSINSHTDIYSQCILIS